MGKKQSNSKKNSESKALNSSADIFQTIFGESAENGQAASLFSNDNPFRRKPGDFSQKPDPKQLGVGSTVNEEILQQGEIDSLNEEKKRKRDTEKDEVSVDISKSKKKGKNLSEKDDKDSIFGTKLEGKGEEKGNAGKELNGVGDLEKKKKKKRKRDELEAEYEAKRYGELVLKDESGEKELGVGPVVGEKRKTLDSAEDMLVSKEGFDDEDKLLRTVFVGNLPLKVKKKALLREFSKFGEVESVRIRSVPLKDTKTPRKGAIIKKQINESVDCVHAYIVFKTEESAQASLSHNMAVVGGNHIRVDRACPPRKKLKGEDSLLYDSKRTVFIGNLPFDVKDEEIYQLFSGVNNLGSSIEAIRVIRDPGTSMGKGIAYVLFKTKDAAALVVKKRNLRIRDRELRLYRSNPNSTPSKRKSSSPAEEKNSSAKFSSGSTPSSSKVKTLSYQGLRASKSGVEKKVHVKKSEASFKSNTPKAHKPKERTGKRPSVAARKAKALKGKAGGGSDQAGKKRKADTRTPDNTHQSKKARKFR